MHVSSARDFNSPLMFTCHTLSPSRRQRQSAGCGSDNKSTVKNFYSLARGKIAFHDNRKQSKRKTTAILHQGSRPLNLNRRFQKDFLSRLQVSIPLFSRFMGLPGLV